MTSNNSKVPGHTEIDQMRAGAGTPSARQDARWVMRRSDCRLFLAALVCSSVASTALAQDAPLGATVSGLLSYARARSPEINAMRQEADAAAQRIGPQARCPTRLCASSS